jgi:pimeloyl-ACP methyl ester carboxylesterase
MSRARLVLTVAGLVVLAAAGLVFYAYNDELTQAHAAIANGGAKVVNTAAGPIEYADRGRGMPLLSIHGAGGGFDQGLSNVADLVGPGFRVIAPSRFGYLGTPIPADASPAAQADAHAALLANLNVPKAVVVGVSAGARSALELALRHPENVSALILIVPGTYAPDSPVMIEESRGSQLAFWLVNAGADFAWWAMEKVAPSVLVRFLGVPPDVVKGLPSERARVDAIVRSVAPLSQRFAGINLDSIPDLHPLPLDKVAAPTLVISARDDLFNTLPAARFAAVNIPNAELTVYETGGHLLVGQGPEVRRAVADFLARANLAPPPSFAPAIAAATVP